MKLREASVHRAKPASSAFLMAGLIFAHPRIAVLVSLVGLVAGVFGWGMAFFVKFVVDHASETTLVPLVALGVSLVYLLRALLLVIKRKLQVGLVQLIEGKIARNFLAHSLALEIAAYDAHAAPDLYSRLLGLEHLRPALEERVLGVAFEVVLVLVAAGIMLRYDPVLACFGMLGALLPALVVYTVRDSIQQSFHRTQECSTRLTNDTLDAYDGVRDLRTTGGEEWILDRLCRSYSKSLDSRSVHLHRLSVIGSITSLLSTLSSIVLLLVGARAVRDHGLTSGSLMFIFTLASTMLGPLESLVISWLFFDQAAAALDRCRDVLRLPAVPRMSREVPHKVREEIRFEKVTFAYRTGPPVLQEISFTIPGRTCLAVVGESGAGKSTMLSLLARHYVPNEGTILIDGADLRTFSVDSWRREIGVVSQCPHLFDGTITENIRLGCPSAGDQEVAAAARAACLDDFIHSLPERFETRLTRGGVGLSAGQIQRIVIARALVRKPAILILDEATSNLDARIESAIWKVIEEGSRYRTTVLVTHRLSSSRKADKILVLDKGKLAEWGSFEELIHRRGAFYSLWKRQLAEDTDREAVGFATQAAMVSSPPQGSPRDTNEMDRP